MGKLVLLWLVVLSLLFVPLQARSQSFAARAPWGPGPPDACSALAVPCAQIDDFNLALRVSGVGFWGAPGEDGAAPPAWAAGGGGTVGATLSLYKTAELGFALPVAHLRAPGRTWIYGPPEVRLRWRMGPRMGPGPFGAAWPADEAYPKALPASYDVQPARWTAAIGFRFRPLWPGLAGAGPRLCRASESSCLAEVGLQASLDLRAWRLLLTAHTEAVAAGDQSHLALGGRVAADVAGMASLFSETVLRQGIADPSQRAGLVLVGAGLRGFRGAHLQAWYGRSFGGVSGDHLAGVALEVPIGLVWGALQALSAAVDPFFARDGWIYDDRCAPLFELTHRRAAAVGIVEGAHLWRSGDTLYHDQACQEPAVAVEAGRGAPVPIQGVATPWPDADAARRYEAERARWLRRFAEAPDPQRRELCEDLVARTVEALVRARQDQTLGEACARARRQQADAMAHAAAGLADGPFGVSGLLLGGQATEAIACGEQMSVQTAGAVIGLLRPGLRTAVPAAAHAPAGVATHAPPAAPAAPGAAVAAGPGAGASAREIPIPPQWFPPTPPARQLPSGPQLVPPARQLPPGQRPSGLLPPARRGSGPVQQGQRGVADAKEHYRSQGVKVLGEEATVITPSGRRRYDLIIDRGNGPEAVEVKTGKSPYKPSQRQKDHEVNTQGGVGTGPRAEQAGIANKAVKMPTEVLRLPKK